MPEGSYTITIRYPDKEEIGKEEVEVDGDGEDVNINAYKISGSVQDEEDTPLKGAAIVLTNQEDAEKNLFCRIRGRWTVECSGTCWQVQRTGCIW